MSTLAACLAALTVWFAGRAAREARRVRVGARLGVTQAWVTGERLRRSGFPRARLLWPAAGTAAGWILARGPGAAIGLLLVPVIGTFVRRRRRAREAQVRDEQLADAVGSVAAALRAGLSVSQSLAYAAGETPAPLGESLRVLLDSVDVGVPLEMAVDIWAAEAGTDDARLFAGVLRLHRRSGGDLPAVLDQVVAALRERRDAEREVHGLTAQARLSGTILGCLPVGFFGFLWLTSRSDIEDALRSPAGLAAMAVGLTLEGLAFLWIRRLLAVR